MLLLEIPVDTWLISATLSMILGTTALGYMATSCLLASRWQVVQSLFGGLDRIDDVHKWLGIWALVFATYHVVFKANLEVWNSVLILELPKYWTRLAQRECWRPSKAEQEIWIGAGVGISPFISWLQDPEGKDFAKATLVYCSNPSRAFPPAEHLQAMAKQ